MEYTLEEMIGFLPSHQATGVKNMLREMPELRPVMEKRLRAKLVAMKSGDPKALKAIASEERQLLETFAKETGVAAAKFSLDV